MVGALITNSGLADCSFWSFRKFIIVFLFVSCQDYLNVLHEDPVDLQFNQSGYLFLANEEVAHIMEENYNTQRSLLYSEDPVLCP